MANKNNDAVYGSVLTRQDLEVLIDKTKKIPFVYIYSCKVKSTLSFDEMESTIKKLKNSLPDFKSVEKAEDFIDGKMCESIIVMFTRNQRSLQIEPYDNDLLLQLSFEDYGKDWGSNYAIWELTKSWCLENLKMTFIQDEMSHVDPTDMRLPK